MFKVWLKFGSAVFIFVFASILIGKAQTSRCHLQFEVYSYNNSSSKTSLANVELVLTKPKSEEKKLFTESAATSTFENLAEGNYRIKAVKKGYKDRKKEVKLDCAFADEEGVFKVNVYLWKGKSTLVDKNDLPEAVSETKNSNQPTTQVKTKSVSAPEKANEKSGEVKLKASGKVTVRVLIDEDGNVVSAKPIDGNSSLANAAVKAARQSKFAPTMIAGYPVEISGDIIYNFVP